ncbi:YdcH family protein, partial [Nafulsella turpanensis]|uniref:YdcH family protein n=1 Tax=Nafulsella turpanensis TaxID=1265690 RepID=UPI0014613E76
MKKNWKHIPLLGLLMSSPLLANAQVEVAEVAVNPFIENGPGFFIAVVAGVLLAIGFQALLTTLSVASGISAIGNIRKKAHQSSSKHKDNQSHSSDSTPVIKKVSSAFGVWTMITVSLSLFFASLLAVKLSFVGANFVGLTLGLVIWAAFFTTVLYLEMKTVSSLIGGLFSMVMSGFRQSASMLSGVFSSSEESKAKSVAKVSAHENARAMRKELRKLFNRNDLDKKIDDYVTRLSPQDLDVKRIKKELKDLLTDIEVKEKAELGENGVTRRMFLETVSNTPNVSKED